jgi:PhnB protein
MKLDPRYRRAARSGRRRGAILRATARFSTPPVGRTVDAAARAEMIHAEETRRRSRRRRASQEQGDHQMSVQPYLVFDGHAEDAAKFYEKALGAQITMLMRYQDSPVPPPAEMMPPGWGAKVMHMCLKIGDSVVFGTDGDGEATGFKGFSLSYSAKTPEEAERVYAALVEGGESQMKPAKTFFSPAFGMLTDRFGVHWMVVVPQ